jgi:foldase protein PrsA
MWVEQNGSNNALIVFPTLTNQLTEEAIVLQYASEREVSASDEEVRTEVGRSLSLATDDPNFDARVQEAISRSGVSQEEYFDISRAAVLRNKLIESFKADVEDALPAAHYRQIQVADQATADDIVRQLNEGADFATLAAEKSEDSTTKDLGGDKGFVPQGLFPDEATEDLLFSLEPDEITTFPSSSSIFVFQLLEKSDAYEISSDQKDGLARTKYQDWLTEKKDSLDVKNEFDFTDGDSDKIDYVVKHASLTIN